MEEDKFPRYMWVVVGILLVGLIEFVLSLLRYIPKDMVYPIWGLCLLSSLVFLLVVGGVATYKHFKKK